MPRSRARLDRLAVAVTGLVLVAGCGAGNDARTSPAATSPTPAPSSASASPVAPKPPTPSPSADTPTPTTTSTRTATPSSVADMTVIRAIPDAQWQRIVTTGTWRPGCPVARAGLRDVDVAYVGFDGATHRGTLVVNRDVASSVARVFERLYRDRYPIRRVVPVEQYGGDDDASMAADNTSAFNCRRAAQANAPSPASPHANGRAVDLNPYENPWVDPRCGCFQPDAAYGTHRTPAGSSAADRAVISKGGKAWQAFVDAGWTWQDSATIDYQHFDTGYPSRPLP